MQMHAEEAYQLRQFRNKLAEVEAQLAAEREAQAASQDTWMGKTVSAALASVPVLVLACIAAACALYCSSSEAWCCLQAL